MSNGKRGGAHYSHLEIGRKVMNSLTRVAKDTLVIEIYELDTTRPKGGTQEDTTAYAPQQGGGEKVAMTILTTASKNPPLVYTAYDMRAPKR